MAFKIKFLPRQSSVFTKIHNQKKRVKTSTLQQTPRRQQRFSAHVVIRNHLFIQQELLYQTDLACISIRKGRAATLFNRSQATTGKDSELRFLQRVNSRKALSDFQVIRCLTEDPSPAVAARSHSAVYKVISYLSVGTPYSVIPTTWECSQNKGSHNCSICGWILRGEPHFQEPPRAGRPYRKFYSLATNSPFPILVQYVLQKKLKIHMVCVLISSEKRTAFLVFWWGGGG